MSQPEQKNTPSTAVQQSDNIAHALAGAGGGVLSMVLTYAFPAFPGVTLIFPDTR